MCLAQGPQHSDADEARTWAPRSRVKHSTTEPLRSLVIVVILVVVMIVVAVVVTEVVVLM